MWRAVDAVGFGPKHDVVAHRAPRGLLRDLHVGHAVLGEEALFLGDDERRGIGRARCSRAWPSSFRVRLRKQLSLRRARVTLPPQVALLFRSTSTACGERANFSCRPQSLDLDDVPFDPSPPPGRSHCAASQKTKNAACGGWTSARSRQGQSSKAALPRAPVTGRPISPTRHGPEDFNPLTRNMPNLENRVCFRDIRYLHRSGRHVFALNSCASIVQCNAVLPEETANRISLMTSRTSRDRRCCRAARGVSNTRSARRD